VASRLIIGGTMALFKKFVKKLKKMIEKSRGRVKTKAKTKSKSSKKKSAPKGKRKLAKTKKTVKSKTKKKSKKISKKAKKTPKKPSMPSNYERIGLMTHYFPHVRAGVIKINKGKLSVGDQIHVKGATTDFKQEVKSLQIDHVPVQSVKKGDDAGLQTKDKVRQHDIVYRIK